LRITHEGCSSNDREIDPFLHIWAAQIQLPLLVSIFSVLTLLRCHGNVILDWIHSKNNCIRLPSAPCGWISRWIALYCTGKCAWDETFYSLLLLFISRALCWMKKMEKWKINKNVCWMLCQWSSIRTLFEFDRIKL
jgi:hypothetical protein